jgi:hypothetical protein
LILSNSTAPVKKKLVDPITDALWFVVTTTTTSATFDHIFVYMGSGIPVGPSVTVKKGETLLGLAIYKTSTRVSSVEHPIITKPKIPWYEWPMVVTEAITDILTKGNGEIYQYLSPKTIAEVDQESLKHAITGIGKRVTELGSIQKVLAEIAERKAK